MTQFQTALARCVLMLVVGVLGALASAVEAATSYYVATTGNDGNTCAAARSASSPRKTLAGGVKCLVGGDTLIVAGGTYERGFLNVPAGSAAAYTTLRAAPGARPRIVQRPGQTLDRGLECYGRSCSFIEMRGFELVEMGGVKVSGTPATRYAHHIRIIDNVFNRSSLQTGTSERGFEGGDHLIQGNVFYEVGIRVPGYDPGVNTIYNPGNRTVIEGNTFHNWEYFSQLHFCNRHLGKRQTCAWCHYSWQSLL